MATKNMSYDHPAYLGVYPVGGNLTGASGAYRFAAFAAMLVKSITLMPTTAGTAADVYTSYKISGTATTTSVLATFTAAAAFQAFTSTFTLAAGDVIAVTKGADATGVTAVGIELAYVPGASVTA